MLKEGLAPTCPPSCAHECVGGFCPYDNTDNIPQGHVKYTIDGDPYCDCVSPFTLDGDRFCTGHPQYS